VGRDHRRVLSPPLQLLIDARDKMELLEVSEADPDDKPTGAFGRAAARCWALLLVRIFECHTGSFLNHDGSDLSW
jgi:hypothetical protein